MTMSDDQRDGVQGDSEATDADLARVDEDIVNLGDLQADDKLINRIISGERTLSSLLEPADLLSARLLSALIEWRDDILADEQTETTVEEELTVGPVHYRRVVTVNLSGSGQSLMLESKDIEDAHQEEIEMTVADLARTAAKQRRAGQWMKWQRRISIAIGTGSVIATILDIVQRHRARSR
jgi:hypothetical protein